MTDEERHAITFLMSYFNPNELLVNKALAFGVYPYLQRGRGAPLPRQADVGGGQPLHVVRVRPRDVPDRPRAGVRLPRRRCRRWPRKEEFEVKFIKRMTEQTLDITTTEGKQDFVRNLVAYNIILEGIWFYSGFMVALSFRQRNLLRNFGSLIDWVVRDESLHLKFGINLILTVLEENPDLQTEEFAERDPPDDPRRGRDGGAVQPRPAAQRHPRPQRRLHQPVREVPGRPPARGARLRARLQGREPGEVDGDGQRHPASS